MHEWNLASGVISSLLAYAKSRGDVKIVSATVRIGTLSMVDPQVMEEALTAISKEAGIGGVEFRVERAKTRFSCRRCGAEWTFDDVEKDFRASIPDDLMISDESGEKDLPTHYFPELIHAWMKCPECGSKDYRTTDVSGVLLEKVELEE
jgi:hydrogenase nickel incorporation protein HypA/HybF